MADWFNEVTWTVVAAFATLNLLVLLYASDTRAGAWLRPRVLRSLRFLSGREDLEWLDWLPVTVAVGAGFAAVSAYGIATGQYGCQPVVVSDPVSVLSSGRAFWAGTDPFRVASCGGYANVPNGLASVLISAVGSLGNLPGIYLVWGAVAVSVLPLAWALAGSDRRLVMTYVGTSILLLPLISAQIDGATNAIVPVAVLLALLLARRSELLGAAVGGFLATARFPTVFPLLGATGGNRRLRYAAFATVAVSFGVFTAVSYLVWGSDFLEIVFFSQLGRRSFSLNLYGVFLLQNALPSSTSLEAVQAALTLALVLVVFWRVRSPVRSAVIVLTGIALLTPFLSFDILVWLLPLALAGARARWWLWGVALVGAINYDLALSVWAWNDGVTWPSSILDVVLTILLLGLFIDLWRQDDRREVSSHFSGVVERTAPRA